MYAVIILVLLALIWIVLIAPSADRRRADKWRGTPFAHRGLHGGKISENSLAAFEAAAAAGFGIELDVRLTRDGRLIVFHDDDLKRMTGDERRVDAIDFNDLRMLRLPDGSQIPTFEEVLACVGGRVPLLVEIKNGKRNSELCDITMKHLRGYGGEYIVESFNPLVLRWLRKNTPEAVRGQLVTIRDEYMPAYPFIAAALIAGLALNALSRPDFVAYNVNEGRFWAPRIQRRLFKTPLAAWTVKDEKLYHELIRRGEMPIFEGFLPANHSKK